MSGSPGVNTQPRCCRLCSEATTRTVCSTGPKASWNHRTSDILRASLTSCRGQTETGEPQRTGQRLQDGAPGMRGSGRPALPCTRGTTAELVGVDGTQESVASLPPPPGQLGRTPAPASAALPDCRGLQPTLSATHTLTHCGQASSPLRKRPRLQSQLSQSDTLVLHTSELRPNTTSAWPLPPGTSFDGDVIPVSPLPRTSQRLAPSR